MSDFVIRVEGLGKKYRIRHQRPERYTALRDVMAEKVRGVLGLGRRGAGETPEVEDFWALKDVSFEVKQGDVVGIIGRNGAGKSTLLKILSRITDPNEGRAELNGRVASLLEVGTGFHPELTGRENIYLNGAILGMTRAEIIRKFEEIVAFAEFAQFLDTPVKRYSSGMYVRLAFAVAAHLDPEILIIGEVLPVGDSAFQKKCINRLGEVGREGRTVLFVSHNLEAVTRLCNKGILLNNGRVTADGPVESTIALYKSEAVIDLPTTHKRAKKYGSGGASITSVWVSNAVNEKTQRINNLEPITISLAADLDTAYQNGKDLAFAFGIDADSGYRLFTCVSSWEDKQFTTHGAKIVAHCHIPFVPLVPGTYTIAAAIIYRNDFLDFLQPCAPFEVIKQTTSGNENREVAHGYVDLPFSFEFQHQ